MIVKFACFITCISNNNNNNHNDINNNTSSSSIATTPTLGSPSSSSIGNLILSKMRIPGFRPPCCISVVVNRCQAIEVYMECDGVPLTRLLRTMEDDMNLCCVAIFTFGSNPRINGAPEALARIRFRAERCGFARYDMGMPSVVESPDFDIRDKLSNWVRFTVDQMGLMLASDGSRPCEVVEWCVVQCFGDTSMLENRLKELKTIRLAGSPSSSSCRQYYIKGFECMRTPSEARIFLEIEPIAKTVLLRCLATELSSSGGEGGGVAFLLKVDIMTFPPNQQAKALAYVSDLAGGTLTEQGNLSEIFVGSRAAPSPCIITRFTQQDLAIWDCVTVEPPPMHWSMGERDTEMARLKSDVAVLRIENSFLGNESMHYSQQCRRFLTVVEELKADRDQLRRELDFRKSVQQHDDDGSPLVGWSEWEMMRCTLEDRDRCIAQLRAQLNDVRGQIQTLERGEMLEVADDLCGGALSALSSKIKTLEWRLKSEFEGGLAFDEERNKYVETGGRTWTRVQWQARELAVYRGVFGSIGSRDCYNELDFTPAWKKKAATEEEEDGCSGDARS